MLISQNELKKYNIELDLPTLDKSLVQLGHEVETVTTYGNDKVIVGKVLECEKHPEADRLNVTQVDLGLEEPVQIVCGAPNVAKGQLVPVATVGAKFGDFKIKKAKLRGQVSQGMICSLAELGLSDNAITEEDKAGIFVFEEGTATVGQNAFEALGLADNVLELGLTANRGDCQNYFGVARDLRALANDKLADMEETFEATIANPFAVENLDPESFMLSSVYLEGVKNTASPLWLKIFLAKHEMKTQNIIVDIANYVLLQTGVPVHTYDADKLNGKIAATVIEETEEFLALDGNSYNLKPGNLVIKDNEATVALASVMGGEATKVTDETTNLLVEIGIFDPVAVRKTANVLGKKTDASLRGEKGVDAAAVENAFALFVNTLRATQADVKASKIVKDEAGVAYTDQVELKFSNIKKVLGIEVSADEAELILNNLHFETVEKDEESITVNIPSWRFDIFNDHDLIEEIIRIKSMEIVEVSDVMATIITKDPIIKNKQIKVERELEKVILDAGLNQVITYSLVNEDELQQFNGNLDTAVKLMMPLSSERAYYRQSLIPSLMEVAKYNFDRQQKTVNIFEIANRYQIVDGEIKEEYLVSGLVAGLKDTYYANEKTSYDFYDIKAVVERILSFYNLNFEIVAAEHEYNEINKYAQADILVDGEYIGFIGKKHPGYFKKVKQDVFLFEMNLKMIEDKLQSNVSYEMVSQKPSMERDITIITDMNTTYSELSSVFMNINHLVDLNLKDIYTGENIQAGLSANTFTITFANKEETLTGEEIDAQVAKIIEAAEAKGFTVNR